MPFTYDDLAAMDNAHSRGYAFEHYVAELLRREQFEVITRPVAANGRQVDLFASRGERHYLIETKWRKTAAGTADVDDLLLRLARGSTGVVGVLISANGFTKTAIRRVEEDTTHSILLVDGRELTDAEQNGALHRLLIAKHDHLIVHRRAAVSAMHKPRTSDQSSRTPVDGRYAFAGRDGERMAMTELAGDFGPTVFCLDLPDLDWSDGRGVALEIPLARWDRDGLLDIFQRLDERGWITSSGTWRIHQQGATWTGFGLASMLESINDPEPRYGGRTMHHSETISYTDTAGGGVFTVTATLARTRPERVSIAMLTFRLPGIPLDPSLLQTLVRGLDVQIEPYFRSLPGPVTSRIRLPRQMRRHRIRAKSLIVGNPALSVTGEDSPDGKDEWVVGAVIENPFSNWLSAPGLSREETLIAKEVSTGNEFFVCTLGSWHYLSERHDYVIDFVETAQVGDALLTRVHLDWYDEDLPSDATSRPRPAQRVSKRLESTVIDLGDRIGRGLNRLARH